MVLKILSGVAALFAVLFVVIAVNTLRIGPPPPGDVPPPADIAFDGPAAAGRLAEALRFRTISHAPEAPVEADALVGLRAFLAEAFPKVHATLTREIVNGYSLLYTWTGSDPTLNPILLAAHMDVVPVEPGTEADWTHPPFAGAVADGFVWGRGAMDMKSSLMGILEAVEYLLDRGMAPKRTVYLAFGHDEEVGGTNGTAKIARLLAKRGVRLGFTLDEGLVIAEGIVPGVTKPAALVGLAEKGRVSLELVARGECGHSSMPPVSTAAGGIGRALHRLETNQMPAALKSPVSGMFDALAPKMPIFMRAVVANRWLLGPLLLSRLEEKLATNAIIRTTTAATVIRGRRQVEHGAVHGPGGGRLPHPARRFRRRRDRAHARYDRRSEHPVPADRRRAIGAITGFRHRFGELRGTTSDRAPGLSRRRRRPRPGHRPHRQPPLRNDRRQQLPLPAPAPRSP